MRGEIGVESAVGQGSTFHFTAEFGLPEAAPRRVIQRDLRGLHVLVVDDNPMARTVLREMLEAMRFRVALAASGDEALLRVREADPADPFDVVLMDWRMPGRNGIEAARELKRDTALRKVPRILLVTAYGREEVFHEAERADLDGILLKPVSESMLFDGLMAAFGSAEADHRPLVPHPGDAPPLLHGARILLAEDNEMNQQVAEELLRGAGLEVVTVDNGAEAVRAAEAGAFDLVLMDLQMPEMDGLEATRRLRANPALRSLPILAMTANAMSGDRDRCLAAGMNDHIAKPIDPDALFAALETWLRGSLPAAARAGGSGPSRLPAQLPGIDVADGLLRVSGNEALFRRLLAQFPDNQGECVARIREALAAGDREAAARHAHTLRGVAGNLGAKALADLSARVEQQVKADGPALGTALDALASAIGEVVAGIATLPPGDAAPAEAGERPSLAEASEALGRFMQLLHDDITEAMAELERVGPMLRGTGLVDAYQRVQRQVHAFDTDAAAAAAAELQRALAGAQGAAT
jgi:CheY-like chemotaxis protein/HPt (histidine-containing phosphotransfer) domain-containing protein